MKEECELFIGSHIAILFKCLRRLEHRAFSLVAMLGFVTSTLGRLLFRCLHCQDYLTKALISNTK